MYLFKDIYIVTSIVNILKYGKHLKSVRRSCSANVNHVFYSISRIAQVAHDLRAACWESAVPGAFWSAFLFGNVSWNRKIFIGLFDIPCEHASLVFYFYYPMLLLYWSKISLHTVQLNGQSGQPLHAVKKVNSAKSATGSLFLFYFPGCCDQYNVWKVKRL